MQQELSREQRLSEKLRRFDDIFRMSLLAITAMITVGSVTFGGINLWNAYWFILFSLVCWIFGHALGAVGYQFIDMELDFKLYAWTLAMLFGVIAATKIALGVTYLEPRILFAVIPLSVALSYPTYLWFKRDLGEFGTKKFKKFVTRLLLFLAVASYLGYLYI